MFLVSDIALGSVGSAGDETFAHLVETFAHKVLVLVSTGFDAKTSAF